MIMKKLRVGVVGLGMGRHHVRGFQAHPSADVVACADVDDERCRYAREELGVPRTYHDYQEMCAKEECDVISIAVPNCYHKPVTCAAIEAGAHVLCEKPMALTTQEAQEMQATAEKHQKRLMINFSYRFSPHAWALKKCVDDGLLGDPYYATAVWMRRRGMPGFGGWFGQKKYAGGGPMIDLGVHRIDLALWLMGYPTPTWVMARMSNHIATSIARDQGKLFDVEDFATAMVTCDSGATLSITASWAGNIAPQELMETRILGTKGGLLQYNTDGGYSFASEIYQEKNGCQLSSSIVQPFPQAPTAYYHFIDAIVHDYPHIATAHEGLIVTAILDAIYQSAETQKPVNIADIT